MRLTANPHLVYSLYDSGRQQVQVVISLPEAFVPETIESVVTLVEPARQTIRRSDVWGDLEISSPAQ